MTAAEIIRLHINDDVYALSAKSHWHEDYDKKWLVQQIQARQKAKSKLPSWYGNFDLLFPPPLSVEQCSSELTAAYKATLVAGGSLIDMTGGMGIDACAFARRCDKVTFIERQPAVADSAQHNFNVLGINNMEVINGDSAQLLPSLPSANCIFLDPARRKEGQKVFRLEDCEPDLLTLMPLLAQKASHLILKISPLFDITLLQKQLDNISAIHIVAVHNEVKELLVEIKPGETATEPELQCVNLEGGDKPETTVVCLRGNEKQLYIEKTPKDWCADASGTFLYEPHPTIMKSGLMDLYAMRFGLRKLHAHSHLYSGEQRCDNFFGRVFEVERVFGMGKAELKAGLAGVAKANITVRNFPLSADALRKKLKLSDGGRVTLFATTVEDGSHVIVKCGNPLR
ncbi:MAG: RsmD family RNA methyltransferase [Bacteroidales bacterium]|nr:RsmD family RNA methyltransferase [Bacteroidales bacterium]